MLSRHLRNIVKFMVGFILVPIGGVCSTQSRLCLSLSSTQPKNLKNVVCLEIGLMHVIMNVYKNT